MIRAAAKNCAHVTVVVDPGQYGAVLEELRATGVVSDATRRRLARAAFAAHRRLRRRHRALAGRDRARGGHRCRGAARDTLRRPRTGQVTALWGEPASEGLALQGAAAIPPAGGRKQSSTAGRSFPT